MTSRDTTLLIDPDEEYEDMAISGATSSPLSLAGPPATAGPPSVAGPSVPPPVYSEIDENKPQGSNTVTVAEAELPPPYTPNAVTLFVNCKVCQTPISLEGRQHLNVLKCTSCAEATPIKPAPAGKKYIRCPCNCLLICSINSNRLACPRANCRRMIVLAPTPSGFQTAVATRAGSTIRATCGHCNQIFVALKATIKTKLTRCPHCRLTSSVGYDFIRRKSLFFGIVGIIFLLGGIITTVVTVVNVSSVGFYFIWIGAYMVGAARCSQFTSLNDLLLYQSQSSNQLVRPANEPVR